MTVVCSALVVASAGAAAQTPAPTPTPAPFHWHDDYTEYHLLDPATNQFHIVYFLNQRQAGLTYVLNQTRSGSAGSDVSVSDPRTLEPLKFDYMTGAELAAAGVTGRLAPEEHYIRAHLPRAVPAGGEGRVRIEKTYKDEKSYFTTGETITFARSLGIGRNLIVLPAGYQLVSSNVAAVVGTLEDGRIGLSFENINAYASDVSIRASRRGAPAASAGHLPELRAADFSKALYDLQPDGSVRVIHDRVLGENSWMERTLGGRLLLGPTDSMTGETLFDMDTGAALRLEREGNAVWVAANAPLADVKGTVHLRMTGTLSARWVDAGAGGLVWHREIHEPRATILLPAGYALVSSSNPVTAGTLPDGRQYLQVVNPRQDLFSLTVRAAKINPSYIVRTTLPMFERFCRYAWASATCSSGKVCATTGVIRPDSNSRISMSTIGAS